MIQMGVSPWTVSVDRQMVEVTTSGPSWRESWKATDSNGHEHRYDRSGGWPPFPTLNEIIDEWHWCDGDEGYEHHDPHEQVDESHFECKICGDVVAPAMDPGGTPKSIAGPWSARIEGPRSDGAVISGSLTDIEFEAIKAAPDDLTAIQALVDAIPDDRIHTLRQSAGSRAARPR